MKSVLLCHLVQNSRMLRNLSLDLDMLFCLESFIFGLTYLSHAGQEQKNLENISTAFKSWLRLIKNFIIYHNNRVKHNNLNILECTTIALSVKYEYAEGIPSLDSEIFMLQRIFLNKITWISVLLCHLVQNSRMLRNLSLDFEMLLCLESSFGFHTRTKYYIGWDSYLLDVSFFHMVTIYFGGYIGGGCLLDVNFITWQRLGLPGGYIGGGCLLDVNVFTWPFDLTKLPLPGCALCWGRKHSLVNK